MHRLRGVVVGALLVLAVGCSGNKAAGGSTSGGSGSTSGGSTSGSSSSGGSSGASSTGSGPGVTTIAGNNTPGFQDGLGTTAEFYSPEGLVVDGQGNLFVADANNHRIRKITPSGSVTTFAGDASTANMAYPESVALDAQGNVFVADSSGSVILKFDASGHRTVLAGDGTYGYVDGQGTSAKFHGPIGVAVDGQGNVYVADTTNNRIRKIDASGNVTTLAGAGTQGFADGTGGPSGTAQFNSPSGVAVDGQGNVIVADRFNGRIRKIDASGNVTTVAGNGMAGFADGTGGPSGTAQFHDPRAVAVDSQGNIYVADEGNNRIRKIDASGNVTTLAGNGTARFADGSLGPTGEAEFNGPDGVAVDAQGNVYVGDSSNNRVRKITP